jgi:RNA polymerase-binding protein DksA
MRERSSRSQEAVPARVLAQIRAQLLASRARLMHLGREHSAQEAELTGAPEPDWPDAAQGETSGELLHRLAEHERAELVAVDAALARLADGSYGRCTRCGQAIDRARLEALPVAETCMACATAVASPMA